MCVGGVMKEGKRRMCVVVAQNKEKKKKVLRWKFSLTSQMSAAGQISSSVFYKYISRRSHFLKRRRGLLDENSRVNVRVSKGLGMVFVKGIACGTCRILNESVL